MTQSGIWIQYTLQGGLLPSPENALYNKATMVHTTYVRTSSLKTEYLEKWSWIAVYYLIQMAEIWKRL